MKIVDKSDICFVVLEKNKSAFCTKNILEIGHASGGENYENAVKNNLL